MNNRVVGYFPDEIIFIFGYISRHKSLKTCIFLWGVDIMISMGKLVLWPNFMAAIDLF